MAETTQLNAAQNEVAPPFAGLTPDTLLDAVESTGPAYLWQPVGPEQL
ncbi:hypothetical protein [Paludibacterium denitrificans]|nr:hypothetical protein [Paludibacterium denitrificans]